MLKSMTAYGHAKTVSSVGRFVVEIQSVNRKHLEVNTFLPKSLLQFDSEIKKAISRQIGRGQVNVKVNFVLEKESLATLSPNLPLARQVKAGWEAIARDLKIDLPADSLIRVLSLQDDLLVQEDGLENSASYLQPLLDTLSQALEKVTEMKLKEGKILKDDFEKRFALLAETIEKIAEKAPTAIERYKQKLTEKLNEALTLGAELDERILREVCLFAEKVDIEEELTRFRSHLKQVHELLQVHGKGDSHGVGKPLEFLLQELNREINTISAKSSDSEVSRWVIQIKTELERIREQVQNIE